MSDLPPEPCAVPPDLDPNPDHAWRALTLVNEWIRHADTKAGVTLAFTGVLAGTVFNLASNFDGDVLWFDVLVVVASSLLVLTAGLCGWTLTPRLREERERPIVGHRLFFASIAKHYGDKPVEYADALSLLLADPAETTRDLAEQIRINSKIATMKAHFAKWGIRSALVSGAVTAMAALVVGVHSR